MRPADSHAQQAKRRERGLVARRRHEAVPDGKYVALALRDFRIARKVRFGDEPRAFRRQYIHAVAGARSRGASRERELPPPAANDAAKNLAVDDQEPSPCTADHHRTVPMRVQTRRPARAARVDGSGLTTHRPCGITMKTPQYHMSPSSHRESWAISPYRAPPARDRARIACDAATFSPSPDTRRRADAL